MATRLTDDDRKDRAMSEKALSGRVFYRARKGGWRIMHIPPGGAGRNADDTGVQWRSSGGSGKGFPDLTMVRGAKLIFVELKRELGKLSDEQSAWIDDLRAAGQEVYVWRPSNLRLKEIDDVLR